jgi:hypothetical protein
MRKVFVLEHSYEKDNVEESKMIGVFSSILLANEAIERLITLPGFQAYPEGFNIDEYTIDKYSWNEGFISWDEASNERVTE